MKNIKEKIRILRGKERERLMGVFEKQFGIKQIQGTLIRGRKGGIYLFTGTIPDKEIFNLLKIFPVEIIGIYLAKEMDGKLRLSIEGSQILKNEITKRIVELSKEEMEIWIMGHELIKKTGFEDYVVMKYKNEMLGVGKASENKITNFIPKSRRLRDKTIEVSKF